MARTTILKKAKVHIYMYAGLHNEQEHLGGRDYNTSY